ncbi:cysteine-tryptophan domain-containing zinc finger protein 3-like isoform X2 [Apium graveolens]|uniref:cysteine-tryptophan domain-containing zinc finger protein 3-like isoform X2 n=1 Tax=Apium graveolens TaxID=4045 RepID=UPI003D7A8463
MNCVVDGRKGSGLGFEMEQTELEEGEACFYSNNRVDSSLDPDVALSYLDEKLEHVLGHFQKDFEGGVSAENLGSKFGGYGSFLPTYQRSPVWSHPKTPPNVQNHNASKSPTCLPLEGAHGNSVSSNASLSARHGSTALGMATLPAVRASSVDEYVKREATMPLTSVENKSDNQSDQKTIKVRIKMCSDNSSTKKNAEIYSGLGLDVSPTSSFEDSPTDGEMARESKNTPDESPTSILEVMTSCPLHGSLMLSPLHDDLICMTDKNLLFREGRSAPIRHRGSQEGSVISVNGPHSASSDRKLEGMKKPKSSDKKAFRMELKNNVNNSQNSAKLLVKKETDCDASVCDELVSNALTFPLLSNSHCNVADSTEGTARADDISRVVSKGGVKEESFCDLAINKLQEPGVIHENGVFGKPVSGAKVSEFKKTNLYDDEPRYPEGGGNFKGERIDDSLKVDPNMPRMRKGLNPELLDHARQTSGQKSLSSVDDEMKVSSGKENSSSGSKRKSKGSHSRGAEITREVHNASTNTDVFVSKRRKNANLNAMPTSELEDSKQDTGKAKDRYKDFFGDLEMGDNDMDGDMPSIAEAHTRASSSLVPPTGNRLSSDEAAPFVPFVKEDWVGCDKCQKWRLLPAGKNPQSLPKIWLCNMLDWLDGMNRCSFSEEETSKAVRALNQTLAPVHEGQSSQNRYSGVALSGVDALHVDQSLQDIGGKKKHGFRDVLNASSQNGSSPHSSSKKKIPQASYKNQSFNVENCSPSLHEVDFQLSGQSSDLVGQKQRHKRKDKSNPLTIPGEGETKSLKIRNKRENHQEFSNASKKLKASSVHSEEEWKSDNGGAALKVGHSSSIGLSTKKTGKHRHKYDDHPKDSKRNMQVSVRDSEDQTQFPSDARLLHMEYIDGDVKKRKKIHEYQESQLYTTSHGTEGHRPENQRDFMEETSESNHREDKKARVSKSGGKERSMRNGSGGIDKKGRSLKDQQAGVDFENGLFDMNMDAIDLVKKDVRFAQLSVAATSSSSKVSGSRKSKANLQEVKGSPVESVSSSPLRVCNQDNFTSIRRDLKSISDSKEVIIPTSSPRKCLDGEDGAGGDHSRMLQKNLTITVINRGSLGSSKLDFQDRSQSQISGTKAAAKTVSSSQFAAHHVTDTLQSNQHPLISENCPNDEIRKMNEHHNDGSRRKSGKGSSSRSKDNSRGTRSESVKGNLKAPDSNGYVDHSSHDEKLKARSKLQDKIPINSEKIEKNIFSKNDPAANASTESGKRETQSKWAPFDSSDKRKVVSDLDSKQNLPVDGNTDTSSKRVPSDKTPRVDVAGKEKSHSLPPSGRGQHEMTRWPQPINGIQKDNGVNLSTASTSECDDALQAAAQIKKSENQKGNGNQPINTKHPVNGHKGREIDAPSPIRRDTSSQAANNAVKEATDLKHLADRLKNSGSTLEGTGLYFQAALKFLYGASLLESSNSENAKHGEMVQSMQVYSSTAKLCAYVAHEYEKSKDMASAALAFKCVEVAYLRVINSSHSSASKDRNELQSALQIVPPGESPSSSASDVDNLNNPATIDKAALNKGANSPQVAGNHVIPSRNRPNFLRLLNFAQDINFAMEASKKSRIAFVAANSREETKYREGLSSVKKALDFNFQDVEGFLRLVRLAMEAISR